MLNSSENSIKYTTVLQKENIEALKSLVSEKVIPSVSQGIRIAVENFIISKNKDIYEKLMREAAGDENFMRRTQKVQTEFNDIDIELDGQW